MASGLLSILFIFATYDLDNRNVDVLMYIELILVIYLCLDWLFFLLMAENRLAYLFKVQSFVSYLTITASFFSLFSTQIEVIDTYELVFMKVIRVFSIGRLEEFFKRKNMPLGRAIFSLTFESLAIILIFASGMLRIENRYRAELIAEARAEDPEWQEDSFKEKHGTLFEGIKTKSKLVPQSVVLFIILNFFLRRIIFVAALFLFEEHVWP